MTVATNLNLITEVKGAEDSKKDIDKINKSVSKLGKTTKSLTGTFGGAGKAFTSFGKSGISIMGGLTKEAVKLTAVAGTLATGFGGLAVKGFMGFEKQMSKVKAITGATEEEFAQLNKIAKTMGATTAFTANEAGQGLEFLGMAGLNVQEQMEALPGVLNLASAGSMELGEAADIATNIMAQYGIEAKNIGRVNDVLAKSATSANTSIGEIAEAMKFLGPVANSMKVGLEESAAAVNVLANNGIKGSMAGQSFSASLLRISKPTNAMAGAMKNANLELFNADGQFVGITETVRQLEIGMAGFTDQQKASTISTVFGIQSSKQWLTLLREGSGTIDEYTTSLSNAEGAAKRMAETQLDNLAGSFTLLKSAISGAMIEIGGAISTQLRPVIDSITKWLTDNQDRIKMWAETAVNMAGIIMGGIINLFEFLKPYIHSALGAIQAFWQNNGEKIKSDLFETWENIKTFVQDGFEIIKGFWEKYGQDIINVSTFLWNTLKGTVDFFFKNVMPVVRWGLDMIGGLISAFSSLIDGKWLEFFTKLDGVTRIFWAGIGDFFKKALTGIASWFGEKLVTMWKNAKDIFSINLTLIKRNVSNKFSEIKTNIKDKLDKTKNNISDIWNSIKENTIGKLVELKDKITGKWTEIKDGSIQKLKDLATKAKEWAGNMVQMFIDGIKEKYNALKDSVMALPGVLKDYLGFSSPTKLGPASDSDTWMPNFIGMLADGLEKGKSLIATKAEGIASSFSNPITSGIEETLKTTEKQIANIPKNLGQTGAKASNPFIDLLTGETANMSEMTMMSAGGYGQFLKSDYEKILQENLGLGLNVNQAQISAFGKARRLQVDRESEEGYIDPNVRFVRESQIQAGKLTEKQQEIITSRNAGGNAGGNNITVSISGVFGTDAVDEIGNQLVERLKGAVAI